MKMHRARFGSMCAQAMSVCALAFALNSGAATADMTPTTGVNVQIIGGVTDVPTFLDQQFPPPNVDASSLASVSRSANGSDGSTVGASATAFADFGTLGVSASGGGSTPPANSRSVSSASTLASAFWDDFLTAIPNPDSLLVPGAPVSATLTLDLRFDNSILAINNAQGEFAYDLFAGIVSTDPVTGVQSSSTLFDDCFVVGDSAFDFCDVGSNRIDVPGNTDGPLTVQLAPVSLPLAILQPFELGVGLFVEGQCNAGPNDTAISSCSFDADAFHTSTATLQPQGDFTLVAASGHDYSAITTPPGSVPEPGTLALIGGALVPLALSRRRQRRTGACRSRVSDDFGGRETRLRP
jgi:hypothetical protein